MARRSSAKSNLAWERHPDPVPDALRGDLKRRLIPTSEELNVLPRRGKTHAALELWTKPGATDFGPAASLRTAVFLIRELKAQGIADDLVARFGNRRIRRSKRGRPGMTGSRELLFLGYVLSGCTSVEAFCANLTAELLIECRFRIDEGEIPSLSTLEFWFAALESDWEVFQEFKWLLFRICLAEEPRILELCFLDPTGWATSARLEHCCPGECAKTKSKRRKPRAHISSSPDDRVLEERWQEVDDPDWGESSKPRSTRTRQPFRRGRSRSRERA